MTTLLTALVLFLFVGVTSAVPIYYRRRPLVEQAVGLLLWPLRAART